MLESIDCLILIQFEIFLVVGMKSDFFLIETWTFLYYVMRLWISCQPSAFDTTGAGEERELSPNYLLCLQGVVRKNGQVDRPQGLALVFQHPSGILRFFSIF